MPGCVLRLSGPFSSLAESLRSAFVPFAEAGQAAKERERRKCGPDDDSTFNFTVSEADGDHVPSQVFEAEAFLREHLDELAELRGREGIERGTLDFGWEVPREAIGQFNRFPSSLLSLCATLELDIEVSVYLTEETDQVPGSDVT